MMQMRLYSPALHQRLFGSLLCRLTKHRRGKRIDDKTIQCPRCLSTWAREKRVRKEKAE